MIRKELLNSVLYDTLKQKDSTFIEIEEFMLGENNLYHINYSTTEEIKDFSINIFELANKCKEWAYVRQTNGQAIISGIDISVPHYSYKAKIKQSGYEDSKYFFGLSEPEAIFKAAQYILENKK